jgi:uridine kinase
VQPLPSAAEMLALLQATPRRQRTLLVGIDGPGASGKSTFARAIAALDPEIAVVEFDDFYRPSAERHARRDGEIGGDFDWRRLRDQVLAPLARDEPGRYQRYDWPGDRLAEWHDVPAGGIVLVEGNYSTRAELSGCYDITVWIEAPRALRLERGVRRGGDNTRERWLTEWMPEEDRYVAAERPAERVDLRFDGSGETI